MAAQLQVSGGGLLFGRGTLRGTGRPCLHDAPDWEHNAWLAGRPDWIVYRAGYLKAVDLMVDYVLSEDRDQDFLVYPIVFLARHATELGLKHLTLDGTYAAGEGRLAPIACIAIP